MLAIGPDVEVKPGESPGHLSVYGNLEATGAIFDIEIAGPDAGLGYDQLFVDGNALFDGGQVNFRFTDGFLPEVDDVFQWVLTTGSLSGLDTLQFLVSSDAGVIDGYLDGSGNFYVSAVAPVPLPPAAWFMATGLAAALARSRRRPRASA